MWGFLRNHAIPPFTFLTPVGNRCITPCVCVKEPSGSRGVILTAGGLSVHKGTVFCRNIRRHIQRILDIETYLSLNKLFGFNRKKKVGMRLTWGDDHVVPYRRVHRDTHPEPAHDTARTRGAAAQQDA